MPGKGYRCIKGTYILPAGDTDALCLAGELLRQGKLVAFPTETVYGLGADALDSNAVAAIYTAKGRPGDNPLIVHIASMDNLSTVVAEMPPVAGMLAELFWPGPLTLVLKRNPQVPLRTTGGLETVAVRMPGHPVALRLLQQAGLPVAAPSANLSGKPSPTRFQDVVADMAGRIEAIIDGGACRVGVESTVLDLTSPQPRILRPGGVTREQLLEVLPQVQLFSYAETEASPPPSPGLKYRHYAPRAPLVLFQGNPDSAREKLLEHLKIEKAAGKKVGLLLFSPPPSGVSAHRVFCLDSRQAAGLYSALRDFDQEDVDIILAETTGEEGLGLAIADRLRRAAGKVIEVK